MLAGVLVWTGLLARTAGLQAGQASGPSSYWQRIERLDRRAARLRRGASIQRVRQALGVPTQHVSWKDVRFRNGVKVWIYATSDSGTAAWSAVFVNGCLDAFGVSQQSQTWYRYGRPGWSYPDAEAKDYRFSSAEERVCATSAGSAFP